MRLLCACRRGGHWVRGVSSHEGLSFLVCRISVRTLVCYTHIPVFSSHLSWPGRIVYTRFFLLQELQCLFPMFGIECRCGAVWSRQMHLGFYNHEKRNCFLCGQGFPLQCGWMKNWCKKKVLAWFFHMGTGMQMLCWKIYVQPWLCALLSLCVCVCVQSLLYVAQISATHFCAKFTWDYQFWQNPGENATVFQ